VIGVVLAALLMGLTGFVAISCKASDAPKADAPKADTPKTDAPKTDAPKTDTSKAPPKEEPKAPPAAGTEKLVPLEIKLPQPLFLTTPKNIPPNEHMEKYVDKPVPPLMVPEGVTNLALKKPVTSSDTTPIIGDLALVTDGDKNGNEGSFVELAPNKQWVQIDLGAPSLLYAIVYWHFHGEARVYHDVIIQLSDDADFITNVQTVYNNDFDNSSGMGVGKDLEYIESYRGRILELKGLKARYVRLYSNGNTSNDMNHYIEVEVYGKPAK
jgi:hypothetical protein